MKQQLLKLQAQIWSYSKHLINLDWDIMIDAPFSPIGMKDGMFGHTGIAGATGFADLNHKVGFGFTNNRQHSLGKLYRTSNSLAKKLYEIL